MLTLLFQLTPVLRSIVLSNLGKERTILPDNFALLRSRSQLSVHWSLMSNDRGSAYTVFYFIPNICLKVYVLIKTFHSLYPISMAG